MLPEVVGAGAPRRSGAPVASSSDAGVGYRFSPHGADPYQPRAERRAALGWIAQRNPALKGVSGVEERAERGSPRQDFGASPTPIHGAALVGSFSRFPVGLNRNYSVQPKQFDHRDAMNAEKIKQPGRPIFGP